MHLRLPPAARSSPSGSLARPTARDGLPERPEILVPFRRTMTALWTILDRVSEGDFENTNKAASTAAHQTAKADEALNGAVILLLFGGFAWFYRRAAKARRTAEALAAENRGLLDASLHEALTDALSGLGNRRALVADLAQERLSLEGEQLLLALFDLDGIKQYDDSFGHPAGDTLLARLGSGSSGRWTASAARTAWAATSFASSPPSARTAQSFLAGLAAAALSEEGSGFAVTCSYGMALMPADSRDSSEALRLADQRMYAQKASGRSSARWTGSASPPSCTTSARPRSPTPSSPSADGSARTSGRSSGGTR